MRGDDRQQSSMFSYVAPEARVPQDHPLRAIRTLVNAVLTALSGSVAAHIIRWPREFAHAQAYRWRYSRAASPLRP